MNYCPKCGQKLGTAGMMGHNCGNYWDQLNKSNSNAICPTCNGLGVIPIGIGPAAGRTTCPNCHGLGVLRGSNG
jgi:DnaJ-class molecular chaperone